MSFRFHRGPSIITVFHDSSSSSRKVLSLLKSYNSQSLPAASNANKYLGEAASPPSDKVIELQVLDRKSQPPTADQMKNILQYLGHDPAHPANKGVLQSHLDKADSMGMPKIKDGPLVVNWDEGFATTTVEGVEAMLERIAKQRGGSGSKGNKEGGGCLVM